MNMMINQWISLIFSRHPGRLLRRLRTRLLLGGPSQSWVSNLRPQVNDFAWSVWGWTDHEQPKKTKGMSFSFFQSFWHVCAWAQEQSGFGIPEDMSEKAPEPHELSPWLCTSQKLMEAATWISGRMRSCRCHSGRAARFSNMHCKQLVQKWFRSGGVEVHRDGRQGDVPMPWTR